MKKFASFLFALFLLLTLGACGGKPSGQITANAPDNGTDSPVINTSQPDDLAPPETTAPEEVDSSGKEILIVYFSATNNTENIANHLETILDADLYEIASEMPYTSDDLNYNDRSSRSSQEMNDPDARPAISGSVDNMDQYDVIFLGYPIWWGQAPRIINTFLESYNLSGKTIAPFCTSASSPMGSSARNLQELTGNVTWLDGQRFSGGASASDVQSWVDSLNPNG